MVGALPSQGADPIPVRLSTEAAGAGMIEKNEVRMVGVLPSQGADPIPVSGMLYPSPISFPPAGFSPRFDTYDWQIMATVIKNRAILTAQYFYSAVFLPHGVTVTKFTLYAYRDDVLSEIDIALYRIDRVTGTVLMAHAVANWSDGYGSRYDDIITSAVIDNVNYSYLISLHINPNNSVDDVGYTGGKIDFTA